MKKKSYYLYLYGLLIVVCSCSPKKQPLPSVESVINSDCLIDNRKYCGWNITIRENKYILVNTELDSIIGYIDSKYGDNLILTLYPPTRYDSSYKIACSLFKDLSTMADVLNSNIEYYYNRDSCGHFMFARMDFHNNDYDTIFTLFQIDSILFNRHIVNWANMEPIARDWYIHKVTTNRD